MFLKFHRCWCSQKLPECRKCIACYPMCQTGHWSALLNNPILSLTLQFDSFELSGRQLWCWCKHRSMCSWQDLKAILVKLQLVFISVWHLGVLSMRCGLIFQMCILHVPSSLKFVQNIVYCRYTVVFVSVCTGVCCTWKCVLMWWKMNTGYIKSLFNLCWTHVSSLQKNWSN